MRKIIGCALAIATMAGCVKENRDQCVEPVAPVGKIIAAVRDKNYDNATEAGDVVKDETLPMRDYMATLVMRNHPRGTTDWQAAEELLTATELTHELPAARFRTGMNEVSLIGEHLIEPIVYSADAQAIELHEAQNEGEDVYLGSDTLTYPTRTDRTIWMLRTKGKLIVDVVNLPTSAPEVEEVEVIVSGIRQRVTARLDNLTRADQDRFEYSGSTTVTKEFHTSATGGVAPFHLLLAPSAEATSTVTVNFMDSAHTQMSTFTAAVTIARNHITRLRAEYSEETKLWTITVLVDGNWTSVNNMSVTEG